MAGARLDDERRALPGRPRHEQPRRHAREPLQQRRTRPIPTPNRRWDSQYPSLWVTDGGGGTFFDIWTPSTFAQAGMLVSDTSTEGRVYEMSSEHHVRYEVQLRSVANWRLYALQTEEERGEGGFALPLEIDALERHHGRELPPLPRHQLVPAVPLGRQGHELEEHPLPQRPLLQQQQGGVRRGGVRPDARRRDPAARVRLAHGVGRAPPHRAAEPTPRPCSSPARRCRSSPAASSTSRAAPSIPPATSTSSTRAGSASTAGPWPPAGSRRFATRRSSRSTWRSTSAGNLIVVSYAGNGTVFASSPALAAGR